MGLISFRIRTRGDQRPGGAEVEDAHGHSTRLRSDPRRLGQGRVLLSSAEERGCPQDLVLRQSPANGLVRRSCRTSTPEQRRPPIRAPKKMLH